MERRLILVIQGDDNDSDATIWLDSPEAADRKPVMRQDIVALPGLKEHNDSQWAQCIIRAAMKLVQENEYHEAEYDITSAILEVFRA